LARETVLVVDEQRSAQTAQSMLVNFSYHVLTASSGEQALGILQSKAPVKLVLAEVQLSEGMSGITLAGRIRVCYPATTVMLMTSAHHPPLDPAIPLLLKPFTAPVLIQRVEKVLSDSRRIAAALAQTLETARTAFETARTAKDELESVSRSVGDDIRQSRLNRSERFCSRLRTAAVVPTILVMEPDMALRYSVCHYLTHCGFRVLEASDEMDALNRSRERGGRIDLLVVATQLPGLDGVELANTIAAEHPETSIIFTTCDDVVLPRLTLRKPFELDDLLVSIIGTLSVPSS
jgi:CheY-like chemotaxis protein